MSSSTDIPTFPDPPGMANKEIESVHHMEAVHTNEQVPGHSNYYEKNGLRTYGDEEDHDHEPPMTFSRLMSLVSMALLFTGSQIPLYLLGTYELLFDHLQLISPRSYKGVYLP
jgi:hypothetical protein